MTETVMQWFDSALSKYREKGKTWIKPDAFCKENLKQNIDYNMTKTKEQTIKQHEKKNHFSYLLELWDDLMFLAEMMLSDSTASAALSSTSALFLMRPGTHKHRVITNVSPSILAKLNQQI